MSRRTRHKLIRPHAVAACLLGAAFRQNLAANPQGMTVSSGTASARIAGSQLNVTVGQAAFLNWNSFNIQPGESTQFLQPSPGSVVFNWINDANPSRIWGSLSANGTVILANANGFYFGPGSMIKIGGNFIATTAPIRPDLGAGGAWQFTGLPPSASIVNYGQIETSSGHSLFLISQQIENRGELSAPQGKVGLYAGKEVLISDRADGRGLSAVVKIPAGAIDNSGHITADAGSIALQAQVVNQNGLIQADSLREVNGTIELIASEQLNLGPQSQISARGDDRGNSPGGGVLLKSDGEFKDQPGSKIITRGGPQGGNGGDVEISAPRILSLDSAMDAGAQGRFRTGGLLLDPKEVVLGNSGSGDAGAGTISAGDGAGALQLNVNSAFLNKNFSQIVLQATDNITLSPGTIWDLSGSTGSGSGLLKLQAGNNIIFGSNSRITDANHWSLDLEAGVNFNTGNVQPGLGSIFLNGGAGKTQNGSLQLAAGNIGLSAGQDVQVGSGSITTTAGGNIAVHALAGSVNAGNNNGGYLFVSGSPGYLVNAALGGISTAGGGDVDIEAGQNVVSIPLVPAGQPPGGSGAYGTQPGNVTVIAGNNILGNFVILNGNGRLEAGVQVVDGAPQIVNSGGDIGAPTQPVSLSLISGNWQVWAAHNLYLSEVRNPNGTFNSRRLPVPPGVFAVNVDSTGTTFAPPTLQSFLFDYAPAAGASLWAGNSITLGDGRLPRVNGANQLMPAIYPPRLSLEAGAGGVNVDSTLVLFPSAQGSLSIVTHNGGNLTGVDSSTPPFVFMSDSALPDWNTFERGNAVIPLHLHDPTLVNLDISGDVRSLVLSVPTVAHVKVGGNAYNFGFYGQNLSGSAATVIDVAGDISYRSLLTTVAFPGQLPAGLLDPGLSTYPTLSSRLVYDPISGSLTFIGPMRPADLSYLLNPSVYVFDNSGQPVLNPDGTQAISPLNLTSAQQSVIQQLFTASQTAVVGGNGMHLAGPGSFTVISGGHIDLGIADGISVLGPSPNLSSVSPFGANLDVQAQGYLRMTATAIANESLRGQLKLQVGGSLSVGEQNSLVGDSDQARGIFTTGGGSISVVANGTIDVEGSRIATYNGGNLSVLSKNGDIVAGSGGAGFVNTAFVQLDSSGVPITHLVPISGSGIMAVTPGESSAAVGNITLQAPHGSINASVGGIEQVAFNHNSSPDNFISLQAGKDINAGDSGVIGANVHIDAAGSVSGVFVGSGGVSVSAGNNFSGTIVGSTTVSLTAGGSVSGTLVGGGGVSVKGETISASIISTSVSASGDTTGSSVGVPGSSVARLDARPAEDPSTGASGNNNSGNDLDDRKKKSSLPKLTRSVGRVTVILPPK